MTKYGMATERETSNPSRVATNTEASSSNHNRGTEGSFLSVIGHKLNRHNYLQWSQSVMMFICGRGKDKYLTSAAVQPKKEDPKYKTWKMENNMVMSWLINSMTNDIGREVPIVWNHQGDLKCS